MGLGLQAWPVSLYDRLDAAVDAWRVRQPLYVAIVSVMLALALGGVWLLVYATNGTSNAYLHAMYLPVIFASLCLGPVGGAVVALAAGVLMGPLMPLDVERGIQQPVANIVYRGSFFLLIALIGGTFAELSRYRQTRLIAARTELAEIGSRNLRLFARLVSERDEKTGGHCERVARNAVTLGRACGMGENDLRQVYWGGLLHDLGKLGVPEAILRKQGRLTGPEFEQIKRHPAYGERVLLDISKSFAEIAKGVRSHHERWDGSGYPDGLAGEEIPLLARIIAIVDVYEAVTSHRPYRGPMAPEEAQRLIAEGSGSHFDPRLVELFLDLVRRRLISRETEPSPLYDDDGSVFDSSTVLRAVVQLGNRAGEDGRAGRT